ncbi:hypothetical protein C0J52_17018 [Blattella germanica]|nr:hypothetical protein C0J52_17018 [Blattella germanica]
MANDKKYTVILKNNGTLIYLLEDGPVPPTVPGAFLALDFAIGLCLNVLLIFTVLTCPILRRLAFNLVLLQLCIACALDCFLNIAAAVAFIYVTQGWEKYKQEMALGCRVNAALTQWTTAVQSIALAALAMDRAIMLRHQDDPKNEIRSRLMKILPILMWVYGTALILPIVATSHIVGVRPFPDRYSCGVILTSENSEDLLYPSLLLVLGYILPWIVIIVLFLTVICHVLSARRRQYQLEEAALQRSQGRSTLATIGNSSMLLHSTSYQTSWSNWLGNAGPLAWEEVKFYLLAFMILVFYVLLLIPHILCVNIPSLTATPQDVSNSSNNVLPPELVMIETGGYDCFFVWCRYSFTILVPIVIFLIHKEVRKKCGHMFCCCCCKNNAVVHLDTARSISACVEKRAQAETETIQNNQQVTRKKYLGKRDKYRRIAHYRTPVLFATSEGLHLRLVDDRLEDSYYYNDTQIGSRGAAGGKEQCWTVEPRFLCEFCDVALIASTPSESIGYPGTNPQQSLGASMNIRKPARPHVFSEQTIAEGDLHVSDETGDSSGEFASKLAKRQNDRHDLVRRNNELNTKNVPVNNNRKIPRVRFAQTVSEIPLSESGVWSAPEDQNAIEQSILNKKKEPPDIPLNQLNPKPKQTGNIAPARSRIPS